MEGNLLVYVSGHVPPRALVGGDSDKDTDLVRSPIFILESSVHAKLMVGESTLFILQYITYIG